jgi:hypothetical protein
MTTNVDSIQFGDIILLRQIIDLACSRGAFRGDELSDIGAVYDRLTMLINQRQTQTTESNSGE